MSDGNLIGQRFGKLTVAEAKKDKNRRQLWLCRCDCAGEILATTRQLTSGAIMDCGCDSEKRKKYRRIEDLTGQRFGKLTVLRRAKDKNGYVQWLCQCDCGNLHSVDAGNLKNGSTESCGCLKMKETLPEMRSRLHYVSGTCLEQLAVPKNRKNNVSGFRGVVKTKHDTYAAQIGFKRKHYYLGTYKTFDEAVQARLDAEAVLHLGFTAAYRKWQKRAETDPEWAEKNPLLYEVEKVNGEFNVITNMNEAISV
ncbi:MAG: hypothetical protein J1E60_00405 [Christensenellaceae bacterium]|nr:hypothetical protein [Christensenellaceae bacterium]